MTVRRRKILAVLVGGALICLGTMLPWMSFFAGLQTLSGFAGLYGRLLFASGALAALLGTAMLQRRNGWLPLVSGILGIAQTAFIVWLLFGLHATLGNLGMHAMLLARPGPGLFVALGGAMLVSTALPMSDSCELAPDERRD